MGKPSLLMYLLGSGMWLTWIRSAGWIMLKNGNKFGENKLSEKKSKNFSVFPKF
jgi:hypothetical protein